jgi:spore coat protein A, manganese oxidase
MQLTRREALKYGLIGGGTLLLPSGYQDRAIAASLSPQIERFQLPFRTPPILQPVRSDATFDYYEITMQKAEVEILPGLKTAVWSYNGITPGPII